MDLESEIALNSAPQSDNKSSSSAPNRRQDKSFGDAYNINSPSFNPELFLQKTFKEYSLKKIMDMENEVVRDTAALHSDMQTLVYENYNKFISATETVSKMKSDFKAMETEIEQLSENMNMITNLSEKISCTLNGSRAQIAKLSSIQSLLEKLQFLFKLPTKLKNQMDEENFDQAVDDYLHAEKVLEQFGHMPSFQGIKTDCEDILKQLKSKLKSRLTDEKANPQQLSESVELLLKLNEPHEDLCCQYLNHSTKSLNAEMEILRTQTYEDLVDFIDCANNSYLSNLCLTIQSYNDIFFNRPYSTDSDQLDSVAQKEMDKFITLNVNNYFTLVSERLDKSQESEDSIILVRALDRFYRRLQAMNQVVKERDFASDGLEIVTTSGRRQCRAHLQILKAHFTDNLTKLRQSLALGRSLNQDGDSNLSLSELLSGILVATVEKLKGVLQDLLVFLQPDLTFGVSPKFQEIFCIDSIREGLVVGFMHHVTATARSFCENQEAPPPLLLVLSKFCVQFQQTHVHHLLNLTDEWFDIGEKPGSDLLTNESEICTSMRDAAQNLLNHYVRTQGLSVSQMLRKSVETRDWLHTIEPRTVRPVMKRVVEDITAIETQVGLLYDEGSRSERSSDSSRKTGAYSISQLSRQQMFKSNWSSITAGQSSIATNIQKLFSERIEIFSSVEFSKVSILTGIVKISLKTLLECVRLRTFSRYGLQQIQVDTHYLQLYLWRFVTDENLVHFLLDEILGSAVHRCLDPVLMEPSVVDIICERS